MMLMGVFAAATSIALASTQIDLVGATNLLIIPNAVSLEPNPKATKINTVSTAMPVIEKVPFSDPGISEIRAIIDNTASAKTAKTEKGANRDPNRRSAMEFAKDDENSTDWIK